MRKLICYLMLFAGLGVACEKIDMQNDMVIEIDDITDKDIDEMLMKCNDDIDGDRLLEAIKENGVVLEKSFCLSNNNWYDNTRVPGSPAVLGFVLENSYCIFYTYTAITDTSTHNILIDMKYECAYNKECSTIYTKSKYHDYTYSARVIYFKDNTIIIDGVLGMDDYMNEDYSEQRYIYLCTLDKNALDDWKNQVEE